jgi:hypothetical protein
MTKMFFTLIVVAAFAVGNALAGSCGGCPSGDKDKSGDKSKEGTKESYSMKIRR